MQARKTLLGVGGGGGSQHGSNKFPSTQSADRGSFHKPPVVNELEYENEEEDDSSIEGDKERTNVPKKKHKMVKKQLAEPSLAQLPKQESSTFSKIKIEESPTFAPVLQKKQNQPPLSPPSFNENGYFFGIA